MTVANIVDLEKPIFTMASEIYGKLHKMGKLTGEFDLLIGTTALVNGWKLATNNQ